MDGLDPFVAAAVRTQLVDLTTAAAAGTLTMYDKATKLGDVRRMFIRPRVLEIRFDAQVDPDGSRRHVRLYFTEPAHEPGLVALELDWKEDDPDGKLTQQLQIYRADQRIDSHFS